MRILLDGDEVKLQVGDWVWNSTINGEIIKMDDLNNLVLVGKEKAFGEWVDIATITGIGKPGGYNSTFNRLVDEDGYKPYHTSLPNRQDDFNKQHKILLAEKASKEHSKNGIDKPQLSLIPQHAITEVAKVFMYGAKKYDEYNYSKGEKNTVYTDACMRHINQYLLGKDNDDESNLLHLAHAVANLMMIIDNTIIGTNIENRNGAYKV